MKRAVIAGMHSTTMHQRFTSSGAASVQRASYATLPLAAILSMNGVRDVYITENTK